MPDWRERIVERRSLVPDLPLFDPVADKALAIFKRLRVPDQTGDLPTFGEASEPWVFDFVRAVFGSYDPERKVRMLREFFLLIPKGNGKTTLAAAIILVAAIMNERPDAELMLIAPSQKIAKRAFSQMHGMIRADAALSQLFDARPYANEIDLISDTVPSRIMVVSADPKIVTGSMATFTLIDETHEFSTMSKAADIFAEIKGSLGKRPDGFLIQISTQSKSPPAGVFKSELTIARRVRDGQMRLPMLPVLYELPIEMASDDGWRDESTWALVNPNLIRFGLADFIRDEIEKAELIGPHQLALIASQHLNVEIGQSLSADGWEGALFWEKAATDLTLEQIIATSDCCVAGVDGGGLDDLFALCVIGRHADTRQWRAWVRCWAQPEVFTRRQEIAPRLHDFVRDGDLVICESVDQDAEEAAEIIARIDKAGKMPEKSAVGMDTFGVATIVDALAAHELAHLAWNVPQGYKLQEAVKTVPRKLKSRSLFHCGQPIMGWAVGNAKKELRGSNEVITKQAAGSAKIDPLMAFFNAAMLMLQNPQPRPKSYLATSKLRVV